MFRRRALAVVALIGTTGLILPMTAAADHASRPHTSNMHALGSSPHPATIHDPDIVRHINSDIAFWGRFAFNGNYDGFRIIDISDPEAPVEVSHQRCNGDQGDIFVWDNILLRSWNAEKSTDRLCDGQVVPAHWEGVHVFDISDKTDPHLVASVELACGSHTLTGARDGDRLIVYSNNSSSGGCAPDVSIQDDEEESDEADDLGGDFIDVIEVPLAAPQRANLLRREELAGPTTHVATGCHDAGLILGEVNLLACASSDTINVFDVGANATPGGSLADPELLYTITEPGVGQAGTNGRWHSAAFTWDGRVLVAGWEPGGGGLAECESTDPDLDKSAFFYDAATGAKLGQWTLPRGQDGAPGAIENCTIHNYNVVPLSGGRHVLVSGNYQAGTWVTDFTDPAHPRTLGWSDPPVIVPQDTGGAWSSYWYNNFIYESSITDGLNVFRFSGSETAGAVHLDHLNPQTIEFSLR
jgi:LVIVD repeat